MWKSTVKSTLRMRLLNINEKFLKHVMAADSVTITPWRDLVKVNPDFPELCKLNAILDEYGPTLFADFYDIGLKVHPIRIQLKDGGHLSQQICLYLAPALLSKLKVEIDRMVDEGILVPTDTAKVSSPLVIVPKPDGSIRVAVDYRQLNDNIEPYPGNVPNLNSSFP